MPTETGLSLFEVLKRADPALVDPGDGETTGGLTIKAAALLSMTCLYSAALAEHASLPPRLWVRIYSDAEPSYGAMSE